MNVFTVCEEDVRAILSDYGIRIRPFTEKQKAVFPSLHALVSAFEYGDIITGKRSLTKAVESRDSVATRQWMETIYRRERVLLPMPI